MMRRTTFSGGVRGGLGDQRQHVGSLYLMMAAQRAAGPFRPKSAKIAI
jgi:hypothetical protein